MAMQTIKNGGFVAEEISKLNANFAEVENDYAKKTELPTVPTNVSSFTNDAGYITQAAIPTNVSAFTNDAGYAKTADLPTKTSDLTNDSGFITAASIPTALSEFTNDAGYAKTSEIPTKTSQLTNDSNFATVAQANAAAAGVAATKVEFTTTSWSNGTFTTAANGKMPAGVMRKDGTAYRTVLVDVQVNGTNVVITADEAFEGYVVLV